MDVNRATIVGRLTRDPEVRTTPSGVNVTSFSVATNFVWSDPTGARKEAVEYHNVVAWRKLGEIVAQYMHKGSAPAATTAPIEETPVERPAAAPIADKGAEEEISVEDIPF